MRAAHTRTLTPKFLSTLSLRRATARTAALSALPSNFYPRSPCGERPVFGAPSFHFGDFYPRSPCGERPEALATFCGDIEISIHALLAESDQAAVGMWETGANFYPRSPCGERQNWAAAILSSKKFLSTLSLRRATQPAQLLHKPRMISIHALLAESDVSFWILSAGFPTFLSTLSLRRATPFAMANEPLKVISIHALLAESDPLLVEVKDRPPVISIHALLAESDVPR